MAGWVQHSIPGLLSATRYCRFCKQEKLDTGHGGETRKWYWHKCPDCNNAEAVEERKRDPAKKQAAREATQRWRDKPGNREKQAEQQRERMKDPEFRKLLSQRSSRSQKKRRAADPEWTKKSNAKAMEYYYSHRDQWLEKYNQTPEAKERKIAAGRNRRAVKHNAICEHGKGCFDKAAKLMPHVCSFCGSTDNIEADHIKPISKGGLDCADNMQPLCAFHNQQKRDKWPYTPQ